MHAAVRDLLFEAGAGPVGVTEIATRAGVHPATIYRRWRSAEALLLEVAVEELDRSSPLSATGDLRADLARYGRTAVAGLARPGGLGFLRAIMAAAGDPATGADGATALLAGRLDQIEGLLDGDRDGAGTRLDAVDVVDGLLAPIYFRALLSTPTTLTPGDVDRLVDNLLAVASHRTAPGHRRRTAPPAVDEDGVDGVGAPAPAELRSPTGRTARPAS